ncbi:MAG: hypothetical protein M3305_02925 [Actinomycetota bacterium]|nr:hypothetical protein [Actinomycetota bacterium]
MRPIVGILVDYESLLAREAARRIWSGLSAAALSAGYTRTTALWESLRASRDGERLGESVTHIFVIGQEHPDAVDSVRPLGEPGVSHLYGVVVAIPERPSPLAGSLLYQGVGKLTEGGVNAGAVEPALLHPLPKECGAYAERLLRRLSPLPDA